jgi:hypothetical protein
VVEPGMKKLIGKFLCLALLISCLLIFSRESTKSLLAAPQAGQEPAKPPVISIAPQDGMPLRIVNSFPESLGPDDFRIRLIMQNQGDKQIRAFTVIADNISGGIQSTRIEFVNLTNSTILSRPSQTEEVTIDYSGGQLPETVRLAVDFVEFSDGSMSGPDVHNSRAMLAGMREGAKREKQRLRDLLKRKGPSAVLELTEADPASDPEPAISSKPSAEWLEGFRSGVGSIRHRIKQAAQANGPKQIELELAKPFDLTEEN